MELRRKQGRHLAGGDLSPLPLTAALCERGCRTVSQGFRLGQVCHWAKKPNEKWTGGCGHWWSCGLTRAQTRGNCQQQAVA